MTTSSTTSFLVLSLWPYTLAFHLAAPWPSKTAIMGHGVSPGVLRCFSSLATLQRSIFTPLALLDSNATLFYPFVFLLSRVLEPLDTRLRRSLYCLMSALALQVRTAIRRLGSRLLSGNAVALLPGLAWLVRGFSATLDVLACMLGQLASCSLLARWLARDMSSCLTYPHVGSSFASAAGPPEQSSTTPRCPSLPSTRSVPWLSFSQ
jgi:hypothetical protein